MRLPLHLADYQYDSMAIWNFDKSDSSKSEGIEMAEFLDELTQRREDFHFDPLTLPAATDIAGVGIDWPPILGSIHWQHWQQKHCCVRNFEIVVVIMQGLLQTISARVGFCRRFGKPCVGERILRFADDCSHCLCIGPEMITSACVFVIVVSIHSLRFFACEKTLPVLVHCM